MIVLWRPKPGPELTKDKMDCFHRLQRELGLGYVMLQNYKCLSEGHEYNLFMMENMGYKHCSDGFRLSDFSALKRLSADSCWRWPLLEEDGQAEFEVSPKRRTPPGALLVPSGTVRVALAWAQVWPSQEERQPSAEILPALVKASAFSRRRAAVGIGCSRPGRDPPCGLSNILAV